MSLPSRCETQSPDLSLMLRQIYQPTGRLISKDHLCYIMNNLVNFCGSGSSVGIATDYGLDGPGSNPSGDEIFLPSRPALGSTQPPVQRVPDLSRW